MTAALDDDSSARRVSTLGPQARLAAVLKISFALGAALVLVALLVHEATVRSSAMHALAYVTLHLLAERIAPFFLQVSPRGIDATITFGLVELIALFF